MSDVASTNKLQATASCQHHENKTDGTVVRGV